MCPFGQCGVNAYDPGTPTTPTTPAGPTSPGGGGGNTPPPAPQCMAEPISPQPGPGTPWWDGHNASGGQVMHYVCPAGLAPGVITPFFVANGQPAAPPPPDPAVLAQEAYQRMPIPKPVMHFGPDATLVAVQVPVWLWVDKADLAPVTVTAGGVSVTATPVLQSVMWNMGEPVDPAAPGVLAAPVTCIGESMYVIAPQYPGWSTQPACGYTYSWRSLADRTAGLGCWTVTASATWVITWTSNTGATGQITAPAQNSVASLSVGEWTTVGVVPGAPDPPASGLSCAP